MKVGIVTYWQTLDNYGQVLQCYALQNVLKSMGHEPFVIRYDAEGEIRKSSFLKRIARIVLYPIYIRRKRKRGAVKEARRAREAVREFNEFRLKYFSFSDKEYKNLKTLREDPPTADCYIAGSDQLWGRKLSNSDNEVYYLAFGNKVVKRVAYAGSFGMKEYPEELRDALRTNLERFDSVSCREYDGVKICEDVGIKAVKTLDPTLIAPVSLYEPLIGAKSTTEDYAYIYSLNVSSPNDVRWEELRTYIDKQSLNPIVTIGSGYMRGTEIYEDVTYSYATIEQWLTNIAHARFVVTTSFHGVVFCILLRRPFVYVPLDGIFSVANNRALDLLRDIGLSAHVLLNDTTYDDILSKPIDWESAFALLSPQQDSSISFLREALS